MTGQPLPANTRRLHMGICDVTGKRQFSEKKRAKTAARSLGGGLHPFRCPSCDYWHLGHNGNLTREQHRLVHIILAERA